MAPASNSPLVVIISNTQSRRERLLLLLHPKLLIAKLKQMANVQNVPLSITFLMGNARLFLLNAVILTTIPVNAKDAIMDTTLISVVFARKLTIFVKLVIVKEIASPASITTD